jgi:hypothetical protein
VPLSLILDILVAFLLIVTIGYAMVLNRRLGGLRRDKAELERMAKSFGDATTRAETSIGKLKNAAGGLKEQMQKAQALRDDLTFLIERGGVAADRLEDGVRGARGKKGPGVETRSAPRDEAPAADTRSDAERELLRALRAAH